jgi:hypothetical protein
LRTSMWRVLDLCMILPIVSAQSHPGNKNAMTW